jgi:hypothetical protein
MRKTLIALAALALLAASGAHAETLVFRAHLTGRDEVPPNPTKGFGDLTATVDTDTLSLAYQATFRRTSGPATAADFHGPATHGKTGPSVVSVADPTNPISGQATITEDQLKDLKKGLWYFSVATAGSPDGEIRGQLRPDYSALENPTGAPQVSETRRPASLSR